MEEKGYKAAYLRLFNRVTDLIEKLEAEGSGSYAIETLEDAQREAEEIFIRSGKPETQLFTKNLQ